MTLSQSPKLNPQEVLQFHRDGFLSLPAFTTPDDIGDIVGLLDGLYDRFDELPKSLAFDLGDTKLHGGKQRSPQINSATRFEPRLMETAYFDLALSVAKQLLGDDAAFTFDHTIYKLGLNEAETPWHQDIAYGMRYGGKSPWKHNANFWLALQDTPVERGCMQFVPGSHLGDALPHYPVGHDPRMHTLMTDHVDTTMAVPCPLGVGGVTIHQPKTLHYTGPNSTPEPRRAWILVFSVPITNP